LLGRALPAATAGYLSAQLRGQLPGGEFEVVAVSKPPRCRQLTDRFAIPKAATGCYR